MTTMTLRYTDNDGDEHECEVRACFEVCARCSGHGTVLNPSIANHAYSQEEFEEAFPAGSEEREAYLHRGGMYDVTCPACNGRNVVLRPDFKAATTEQRAFIRRWRKALDNDERERANELRTIRGEMGLMD